MRKKAIFANHKHAVKCALLVNVLKLKKILLNIYYFAFGKEARVDSHNSDGTVRVAAGDPSLSVSPVKGLEAIPDRILCENSLMDISTYKFSEDVPVFTVDGSSMSPEGLSNGDKLLCRKVDAPETIGEGKFAVIAVDKEYYKFKNKELKFDYKLRRTLYRVPLGMSIDELIGSLKKVTNSIFLEENQKNLMTKYNEAIKFYGTQKELMLSVTYRKGELRYSFHPVDLITYVAEYVLKHNGEEWRAKKLE